MHERRGAPATPCRAESSFLSSLSQLFSRGFSEMRRRGGDPSRPAPLHALSIRPSSLLARGRGGRMRGGGGGAGRRARQPSACSTHAPRTAPPRLVGTCQTGRCRRQPFLFCLFFIKSCTNPALWFLPPLTPLLGSGGREREQGQVPSEQRWRERCGTRGAAARCPPASGGVPSKHGGQAMPGAGPSARRWGPLPRLGF